MTLAGLDFVEGFERSPFAHPGEIEDTYDPCRVAHPLHEVLFLVVRGAVYDCGDNV